MITVIAASDKARVLAERLGSRFLNTKALPDMVSREKTLVLPCFIYGGSEYKRAVEKIKTVCPYSEILPPLIRNRDDYFEIKSLVSQSENDIFLIHKSKALNIDDEALWKIGESDDGIFEYIKGKNIENVWLYMLFIDTRYHYENDIMPFIKKLENNGIKCGIKMRSVFENKKIIDYIIKRTRNHEIERKTAQAAQNTTDKSNCEGNFCTEPQTYLPRFC